MAYRHSSHHTRLGLGLSADTMFSDDGPTHYSNHIGTSNLNASSSYSQSNASSTQLHYNDIPELHHDFQQYTPPSVSPQILSTPPLPWDIKEGIVADDDAEMMEYYDEQPKNPHWEFPRWSQWIDGSSPIYHPTSQARSSIKYSEDDFINDGSSWHSFHRVRPSDSPAYSSPDDYLFAERRSMYPESYPSQFFDTTHSPSSSNPSNPLSLLCTPANFSSPFLSSTSITQAPPPLTLHQPRPSRRIPIISISELASAFDDGDISYPRDSKSKSTPSPERDPLPQTRSSFPSTNNGGYNLSSVSTMQSSTTSNALICKCGCMGS